MHSMDNGSRMIYDDDPWLEPYRGEIDKRHRDIEVTRRWIAGEGKLSDAVNNHMYYGLHRKEDGSWVFREWAPNATGIFLVGDFNNWRKTEAFRLVPVGNGNWEIELPYFTLQHGDLYKLYMIWPGGAGERIPAYATRVVQDSETKAFSAQVWSPEHPYEWHSGRPGPRPHPFIYECHIGMSSEEGKVSTFEEFRVNVLPRVARLGYDTLQIMALQEHPYYGSFGYQVSSFFALSSRFGTPEEFKRLVDEAHSRGIGVIMDIVQSHSVDNVNEGLSMFDGREDLYFHYGPQGRHPAWGSRCFEYGKLETKYFLLSNCKYWMEEYHLDGFRFDGVTSMLYWDHGLGKDFGDYGLYFNEGVDEDALIYLALANMLVREIYPDAVTIAEDVSGMPGLAAPYVAGGVGFGFRMAMGVADHWIKWIKEKRDEDWSVGEMWWELTNKRADEKTVGYAECHDQAMVGDKTIIFRLLDKEMYYSMGKTSRNLVVDRGIALHKMIRLVTASTAGDGYLNFMGNEFGHPEWIDFPREGNGWSYGYARRQWSLADNDNLLYGGLEKFDAAMVGYLKENAVLEGKAELLVQDEQKKILIFKRNSSIFAFNFNPGGSFADYGFGCPAGKYSLALSTDDAAFGGYGRVGGGTEEHFTLDVHSSNGPEWCDSTLQIYLPARTAVVLKKE